MNEWKNKTILVADDDLVNFKLMNFMLKQTGANVIWAKNGQEAVNLTEKGKVDAIIMDVQMPVMDGNEAASKIREINQNVPIIILSAYTSRDLKLWTQQGGSNGYLNKPVHPDNLFGTIDKFFGPGTLTN